MSSHPPQPLPKIAFAGLGAMGSGMASHLLHSSYPLTAYDIHPPTLTNFLTSHPTATSASSPRTAVRDAEILIVMVATAAQATPLLFDEDEGAVRGLKRDAVLMITSTVSPAYIADVARKLQELGRPDIALIDTPVSGGSTRAASGELSLFASAADPAHLVRVRRVLCALGDDGKKLYEFPALGDGSRAKLVHQVFAGINIAAVSEVLGMAAVAGWDTRVAWEGLSGGKGGSWMFGHRGGYMLEKVKEEERARYSAVGIIAKDAVSGFFWTCIPTRRLSLRFTI
ncbi:MAG: hypothetical protein Q9219_002534 [cf. Caloplaca sp. 3 TL-2023]